MVIAAVLAIAISMFASAQDSHYWTNQYGPRGELLGGLVVGAFSDLSATYYNPAATAVADEPILNLTTAAYQLIDIGIRDVVEDGVELNSTRVKRIPSIIAFQLPVGDSRNRFAASVLTRHDFKFGADERGAIEYVGESGGVDSVFASEAFVDYSLSESWGGITWGFPLAGRIGLGVTTYVALRNQKSRQHTISQTVDATGGGTAWIFYDDISYWNSRVLWKVGLVADFSPLTVGLTLTTPSVNLFGDGRVSVNEGDIVRAPDASLMASDQNGLASTYKSALAVAGGASCRINGTTLYVSAEWFGRVSEYKILDATELTANADGESLSIDVKYDLAPVFNWGVAAEHRVGKSVDLYAAFITDHSALDDPGKPRRLALTGWDIRQLTIGSAFSIRNFGLTTGLSFGWGAEHRDPVEGPRDTHATPRFVYRSYKLLLGFEVTL